MRYLLSDHLGGAWATVDHLGNGARYSLYYAYGQSRLSTGGLPTDRLYTGQTLDDAVGLYHYGARSYDPYLGRFVSADTIVSDFTNPQSLNRYSYVLNNPLRFTDPTGLHGPLVVLAGLVVLAVVVLDAYDIGSSIHTIHFDASATPYEVHQAEHNLGLHGTLMAMDGPAPIGDGAAVILGAGNTLRKLTSGRFFGRATTEIIRDAAERVAHQGWRGSIAKAKSAAVRQEERLPGLFAYGKDMERIQGYDRHHLWPTGLGGPDDGWAIYVSTTSHYGEGSLQHRLNNFLIQKTGVTGNKGLKGWALDPQNRDMLLQYLRDFYKGEDIPFPY